MLISSDGTDDPQEQFDLLVLVNFFIFIFGNQ